MLDLAGAWRLLVAGCSPARSLGANLPLHRADAAARRLAVPVGTGCTGAAGPLALAADNLPWLGGTFRSTALGFPPVSLGVHALGTPPAPVRRLTRAPLQSSDGARCP